MESTRDADKAAAQAGEDPPPSARSVVWVLDDSPMESAIARRALSPRFDVETFAEGSAMLERLAAGSSPSVLVLDWQLPGMSGIEICRFLRTSRDEMELPVLMLTVYGHKSDLVDGLDAGANDYLTKPYEAPELAARVATLARIRVLHERARRAERMSVLLLAQERSARADAEDANRAKDGFLAMVSHELRTPLNAILGWTRLLRGGVLPAEQEEKALATVERNAVAQAQLIEDLLDMSRILGGQLTIERQPVELVGLIQTSVDAVRPSAQSKGIRVELRVEPDAGSVSGDPSRLQQVILNLVTNAIKFTPAGGHVVVSLDAADGRARLSVVDTGAGIAKDFLPHVFERFRQGQSGARRTQGGLGLGLAIVKHIVELHDGTVQARSDGPGLGSTFVVTMPQIRRPASLMPPADSSDDLNAMAGSARLAGVHVLVVDDDADGLAFLGTLLRAHGADVASATSAARALELVVELQPDVVVSDVAMPHRDGYDMIRSVRGMSRDSGGATPALALTAFGTQQDRALALAAGFDMLASKPIDPLELVDRVASLAQRPRHPA